MEKAGVSYMDGHPQIKHGSTYRIIGILLILSATILQKIGLPGISSALPISTLALPILVLVAFFTKNLIIDQKTLIVFAFFAVIVGTSLTVNGFREEISLYSILLIFTIQLTLVFRRNRLAEYTYYHVNFFRNLMLILSVIGISQFILQFLIGKQLAFFFDFYVPEGLLLERYNNLIPLYYGSDVLKSNGVFFAEPSFFGQYVALGAIIELVTRKNLFRLIIFATAMLCSYSGTGIVTLGLFGGYLMIRSGNILYMIASISGVVLLTVFGNALEIGAITGRIDEITRPGSSGYARFISPFDLIGGYQFTDLFSVLFGKGPGVYSAYGILVPFGAFDPTWAKLIFEYGFIGFFGYLVLFFTATANARSPLKLPIITVYFLFGGYLANASVFTFIVVLLIWGPESWDWQASVMAKPTSRDSNKNPRTSILENSD